MKKLAYILVPVLALSIVSCNKKEDTPTPTPTPTPTAGPSAPSINVAGVDAAFIGLTMTFTTVQAGIPIDLNTESGIAAAYSAPYSTTGTNTMIDAGVVKVNNIALDKGTTNAYIKTATAGQTPADLGFSSGMVWNVAGNANFPAVNRNVYSSAPDYTGTVPETVTRTNPLTFTFNGTTTPHADSVYVVLISGSTNKVWHYSGTAGTVTIPASELSSFSASSASSPAYIEICPWNALYITEGLPTKNCVYIRERAIVKSVTVN